MRRDVRGSHLNGRQRAAKSDIAAPAVKRTSPILIIGGAGFIGCNLAGRIAAEGQSILILDALSRPGVEENLARLKARHPRLVSAVIADVRDEAAVVSAVKDADGTFHLAAQVAVTASLDHPLHDFEVNARGTLTVLDAVRRLGRRMPLIFASTNKVYGDLADLDLMRLGQAYRPRDPLIAEYGIAEDRRLDFHTPYGCSKGAADQYVLDYARTYGLATAVFRMSCIYGPHQCGTEDQGWVAHFLMTALRGDPITIYGDGCQVRDILHVEDAVTTYLAAYRRISEISGQAFNLGGGPANAVSLLQVLARIEEVAGRRVELRFAGWRPGDQRYYVSDSRRITAALDLPAPLPWREGVARLAEWFRGRTVRKPAVSDYGELRGEAAP